MLLLNSLNKKRDVMLSSNDDGLDKDIAQFVWDEMRTKTDLRGRSRFYYEAAQSKDEVRIIEQSLKMDLYPLDIEMWNLIRAHDLCRTPAEELRHRFESAEVAQVPQHSFALHMERLLKCLLSSSPAMEKMEFSFVEGGILNIDAVFFAGKWKIHNKWLTHGGVHEGASSHVSLDASERERKGVSGGVQEAERTFCDEMSPGPLDAFVCDHAVLELWDIMIAQLMDTGDHPDMFLSARHLKSMAHARVAQMPRHVACTTTATKGELRVTWESVDSYRFKNEPVEITIIPRIVMVLRTLVSYQHNITLSRTLSKSVSDGVRFEDLDHTQFYMSDVSRYAEGAFIAVQSTPRQPLSRDRAVKVEVRASVMPILGAVEHTPQVDHDADLTMNAPGDDDDTDDNDIVRQVARDSSTSVPPPEFSDTDPDLEPDVDDASKNGNQYSSAPTDKSSSTPRASASMRPASSGQHAQRSGGNSVPKRDTYELGAKIEHRSLDWGGSFPGSHDFYRTLKRPEEEIFILKPKAQQPCAVSERPLEVRDRVRRLKRPRRELADDNSSMDET